MKQLFAKHRILSLIVAAAILFSVIPLSAAAQGDTAQDDFDTDSGTAVTIGASEPATSGVTATPTDGGTEDGDTEIGGLPETEPVTGGDTTGDTQTATPAVTMSPLTLPAGTKGESAANPATTQAELEAAIGAASDGDTIYIANPTGGGDFELSGPVNINITLTITGVSEAATVLKVSGDFRHFTDGINITLTLENMTLQGRKTNATDTTAGGGVSMGFVASTLVMENVTVKDCYRDSAGGGMYAGNTTLTNCTITGNTASSGYNGGGVYVAGSATLTMTNCTITGNTAGSGYNGGGVYVGSSGTLKMADSGTGITDITRNTVNGDANNVYLPSGKTIELNGALNPASRIGVTLQIPPTDVGVMVAITGNGSPAAANFVPDQAGLAPVLDSGNGVVVLEKAATTQTELVAAINQTSVGTIYIKGNFALTSAVSIGKNLTIIGVNTNGDQPKLTLGGTQNFRHFTSTTSGITLTLENMTLVGINSGTSGGGGVQLENGGSTLVMENVTIKNCYKSGIGGGVYTDGSTTLTNCTITNNKGSIGGGVYAGGSATLTNCKITGNAAISHSGGVDVGGTLKIADNGTGKTTITDNTKSGDANNIYLLSGNTITLTGALNAASRIGVTLADGTVIIVGDSVAITSGSALTTTANFLSDKAGLVPVLDGGVVKLLNPAAFTSAATNLSGAAGSGEITFSWAASNPPADSYNVYYLQKDGAAPDVAAVKATGTKITGAKSASSKATGLTNGKNYYFVVESVKSGYTSIDSAVSTAVTPQAATPVNPPVNPSPSGSGSSSDSGSGTTTSSTPQVTSLGDKPSTTLNDAIDKAADAVAEAAATAEPGTDSGNSPLDVKLKNVSEITPKNVAEIIKKAKELGTKARLSSDTISESGRGVEVRVTVDPELITETVRLDGYVRQSETRAAANTFNKYFENQTAVVSLGQQGEFGQTAKVAAKLDLSGFDTENIYIYSYDKETGKYSRIDTPYRIDSKGYLHFYTDRGGDIIVSNGPLTKSASTQQSSDGTLYYMASANLTQLTLDGAGGDVPPAEYNAVADVPATVNNIVTDIPAKIHIGEAITPVLSKNSLVTGGAEAISAERAALMVSPAMGKTPEASKSGGGISVGWAVVMAASILLSAMMLWAMIPRKDDALVSVEEYRKKY